MNRERAKKPVKLSPQELDALDEAIKSEGTARWFSVEEAFDHARQQRDSWLKSKNKDKSA